MEVTYSEELECYQGHFPSDFFDVQLKRDKGEPYAFFIRDKRSGLSIMIGAGMMARVRLDSHDFCRELERRLLKARLELLGDPIDLPTD